MLSERVEDRINGRNDWSAPRSQAANAQQARGAHSQDAGDHSACVKSFSGAGRT